MDTLFGWPQAPTVSPLELLGLLAGLPLVVIVLIFAIAKADAVMKAAKHGSGPQPGDPVWMGGRARSIMGGADDTLTDAQLAQRQLTAPPSAPTAEADAGGASARW